MAGVPRKRRQPPNNRKAPGLLSKKRAHATTLSAFGLRQRTRKRTDHHRYLPCIPLRNENQSYQEAVTPTV
jgi:hypothetical protein